VIAISATYWQAFWQRLQRPLPLSTIDDLADQLKAVYQLFNYKNLGASPLLAALACIAWLIPLAVVFPPTALQIVSHQFDSHDLVQFMVPNYTDSSRFVASSTTSPLDKRTESMVDPMLLTPDFWNGPTSLVRRSLFATAYQGQLPKFTALRRDTFYQLEFEGPSIQCNAMDNKQDVCNRLRNINLFCACSDVECETGAWHNPYFIAWVGDTPVNYGNGTVRGGTVPFAGTSSSTGHGFNGLPYQETIATDTTQAQALYLAYPGGRTTPFTWMESPWNMVLMNCTLWNATYSASFSYESQQHVHVDSVRRKNAIVIQPQPDSTFHAPSLGDLLARQSREVQSNLAVMQVLGELLVGSLYGEGQYSNVFTTYTTDKTHVLETNLAYTKELFPVYANYTGTNISTTELLPLQSVVEDLFQNMTLALLNVPQLLAQQNSNTSVLTTSTSNIYLYDAMRLWTSYGAALAASLLAVAVGLASIVTTGASYSNRFSTIVRASRDQYLPITIEEKDRRGRDPLPKYIGKARFAVEGAGAGKESIGEGSSEESLRLTMIERPKGPTR
jgi:hypothetical protein